MTIPEAAVEAALDAFYVGWRNLDDDERANCLRDMRAALAAYERAAWQPMETAPRDGTEVDLWANGKRYVDCHFHCGDWLYWNSFSVDDEPTWMVLAKPAAWRPLPAPPAEEGENAG